MQLFAIKVSVFFTALILSSHAAAFHMNITLPGGLIIPDANMYQCSAGYTLPVNESFYYGRFLFSPMNSVSEGLFICDSTNQIEPGAASSWQTGRSLIPFCNERSASFGEDEKAAWMPPGPRERTYSIKVGGVGSVHQLILCNHYHEHKGDKTDEIILSLELDPVSDRPDLHEAIRLWPEPFFNIRPVVGGKMNATTKGKFMRSSLIHPAVLFVHGHSDASMMNDHVTASISRPSGDRVVLLDAPLTMKNQVFFLNDTHTVTVGPEDTLEVVCMLIRDKSHPSLTKVHDGQEHEAKHIECNAPLYFWE